jgi:hypothetical protein
LVITNEFLNDGKKALLAKDKGENFAAKKRGPRYLRLNSQKNKPKAIKAIFVAKLSFLGYKRR